MKNTFCMDVKKQDYWEIAFKYITCRTEKLKRYD